jgi:hypothetical protein
LEHLRSFNRLPDNPAEHIFEFNNPVLDITDMQRVVLLENTSLLLGELVSESALHRY